MGVATGVSTQSTNFAVPCGVDFGPTELCVIANGIASDCVIIQVSPFHWRFPIDEAMVNILIGNLADGPLWVLGPNGPVPVDPWGPRVAKQAGIARGKIIDGVNHCKHWVPK